MINRPLSSISPVTDPELPAVSPFRLRQLHRHLSSLPDPRMWRQASHPLGSILFIALCSVLCGGEGFTDMELYGRTREAWLRTLLPLGASGIPSHDTFNRVLSTLHWHDFEGAVRQWTLSLLPPETRPAPGCARRQLALDGKTLRGTRTTDEDGKNRFVATVNVWAAEHGLVLDQRRIPEEGSEITALQLLLKHLKLKGAVVSMDAAHAQHDTISAITKRDGDYLVSLRANQPTTHAEVTGLLDAEATRRAPDIETTEKGHGRVDTRKYWICREVAGLETRGRWSGLQTLVLCKRETYRMRTGKTTSGQRYFLTSLPPQPALLAACVRRHWQVENCTHWVLDVIFREDYQRARTGYAATNLSMLRKMALNLLRQHTGGGEKTSLKAKRFLCALNPEYLADVVAPIFAQP